MNKEELLRCIKAKSGKPSIKFPSEIDFEENNHVITLRMRDSVAKNMQDDSAAFEGWILCLKACLGKEAKKFCLEWDKPAIFKDSEQYHYQRFLYRVEKFNNIFGNSESWFFIDQKSEKLLTDLKIKEGGKYVLNSPSTSEEDRINNETKNPESRLENERVIQQDRLKGLKELCPAQLQRQLPVGLFHDKVKDEYAIFPKKHSAIDLWGITGADLYILELKAKGNCKVGILSELFFYTMMLQDEQAGKFVREASNKNGVESIKHTNKINAFILAPELHPFVTKKVFDLLNEKLRNQSIEFDHITFDYEPGPKLKSDSFKRGLLE